MPDDGRGRSRSRDSDHEPIYRELDQLRDDINAIQETAGENRTNVGAILEMIKNLRADVNRSSEESTSLRRAVVAFAFTVAGSAVVFAFTVLVLLGHH